jgi:hypothetical protein
VAFGDPYVSLEGLKSWLKIPIGDTADDLELEAALTAASSAVELATERQFNRDTAETPIATTRKFRPRLRYQTQIDDLFSLEDLVITADGTTLTAGTDFELEPMNGIWRGMPGWPFWILRPLNRDLDPTAYSLEVTTPYWGWETVPAGVAQATRILSADLFKLKDAPLGVAGFGEMGVVRVRENSTVSMLVKPYRKYPIKVR